MTQNRLFSVRLSDNFKKQYINLRRILSPKKETSSSEIDSIFGEFNNKKKIIVLCSGPSANKVEINNDYLYIVTNTGYKLVRDMDYLFYLNDWFYIRQNLYKNIHSKKNQHIFVSYFDKNKESASFNYTQKNLHLFNTNKLFLIDDKINKPNSKENYSKLTSFLESTGIDDLKVPNSGVFLLMLGHYYSTKMNLPLEIYGLDLGIGGHIHFNNEKFVTGVITKDYVKQQVKDYLDLLYQNNSDIKNYSNFYGNMSEFKEQ